MKIFFILLFISIIFIGSTANISFSEPLNTKKWGAGKYSYTQGKAPFEHYHIKSQETPPLTVSMPNESPSMTVSIPQNPSETVSIPNSNPETVTPLPGYSEPDETVEIPNESGH